MTLQRGSDDLLPIYRNCVFRSDVRADTHSNISQELTDHKVRWIRGAADTALFKGTLQRLRLFVLRYGAEVEVTPRPFDDFALVHMSLRGAAEIDSDGQHVDIPEGRAAVLAPKRSIRLRWYSGTEQLILKIPYSVIREASPRKEEEDLQLAPGYLIPRTLASQWDLVARSLLNIMGLPPDSGVHQAWIDHYERNVALFLLAHQATTRQSALTGTTTIAGAVTDELGPADNSRRMDAVLQYMNTRLCAPISLHDLASAAGVSMRTLNTLSQRHYGISPMELLRNLRLDAVHETLRANPAASITATALDFGFGHLGRFATYYAERFGELPRQTLHRASELA